jgi:hypothetical protein
MGLFRKKPTTQPQPQRQASTQPPARAEAPQAPHALLEASHPVFQLTLGMGTARIAELLGDAYLSISGSQLAGLFQDRGHAVVNEASQEGVYWLYSDTPAGHDVELEFRAGALASAIVKRKNADGTKTVLMTMDGNKVEAAPLYQAFVDREIQRRTAQAASRETHQSTGPAAAAAPATGRPVERVVILHAGDDPSRGEMLKLLDYAEKTLAIETTGVPVRVKAYRIPPERITRSFGMTVLVLLEKEGEITNGAAGRAWVGEVAVNDNPRVIIVVYKQVL